MSIDNTFEKALSFTEKKKKTFIDNACQKVLSLTLKKTLIDNVFWKSIVFYLKKSQTQQF